MLVLPGYTAVVSLKAVHVHGLRVIHCGSRSICMSTPAMAERAGYPSLMGWRFLIKKHCGRRGRSCSDNIRMRGPFSLLSVLANKPALIGTLVKTTVNASFLCFFFGGCASSSLHVRVGSGGCAASSEVPLSASACKALLPGPCSSFRCAKIVGVVGAGSADTGSDFGGATGFCGTGVGGPPSSSICSAIHKAVGEKGPTGGY